MRVMGLLALGLRARKVLQASHTTSASSPSPPLLLWLGVLPPEVVRNGTELAEAALNGTITPVAADIAGRLAANSTAAAGASVVSAVNAGDARSAGACARGKKGRHLDARRKGRCEGGRWARN
jgi:hypothetical protein